MSVSSDRVFRRPVSYVRLRIPEGLCAAVVDLHGASSSWGNAVISRDDVRSHLGDECYDVLRKHLVGLAFDTVAVSFLRVRDGFMVAISSVDPDAGPKDTGAAGAVGVDTGAQPFLCDAMIRVNLCGTLGTKFAVLYVPNTTLALDAAAMGTHDVSTLLSPLHFTGIVDYVRKGRKKLQNVKDAMVDAVQVMKGAREHWNDLRKKNKHGKGHQPGAENKDDSGGGAAHSMGAGSQGYEISVMHNPSRTQGVLGGAFRVYSTSSLSSFKMHVPEETLARVTSMKVGDSFEIRDATSRGFLLRVSRTKTGCTCECESESNRKKNAFRQRFDLFAAPHGSIVHMHEQGVYVHGVRNFLADVLPALPSEGSGLIGWVRDVDGLDADLCTPSALERAVAGLRLRTDREIPEHLSAAFERLQITPLPVGGSTAAPPVWADGAKFSVFPLPSCRYLPAVLNEDSLSFLCRRGMQRPKARAVLMGAYAVFSQSYVRDCAQTAGQVVVLDTLPGSAADAHATQIAAAYKAGSLSFEKTSALWDGTDVEIAHVAPDFAFVGAHGVFCVTMQQPSLSTPDSEFGRVSAKLNMKPNVKPRLVWGPSSQADTNSDKLLSGNTVASAVTRLAYIDGLTSSCRQYTSLARTLRAVWLFTEQRRLSESMQANATDDERRLYYCNMAHLSRVASLPLGINYWATVPYL